MSIPKKNTSNIFISRTNSFSHSVVERSTAIPAFIGYTPRTEQGKKSYLFQPTVIKSMTEFLAIYGHPADPVTKQTPAPYSPSYYLSKQQQAPAQGQSHTINGDTYSIEPDPNTIYYLYNSLQLFFQNGGDQAHVVSIGAYGPASGKPISPGEQIINPNVLLRDMQKGLATLKMVQEITMYIFPEATLLSLAENGTLMEAALMQCGAMRTAMSIFDIIGSRKVDATSWSTSISNFRNATGSNHLMYGAAYFPFLKTTAVAIDQVTYSNINGGDLSTLKTVLSPATAPDPQAEKTLNKIISDKQQTVIQKSTILATVSTTYAQILRIVQEQINTLPPSGAIAGIYSSVDSSSGVWKAPANVSINSVISPTINIDSSEQEGLNIDTTAGKSINAIRSFAGRGVLVWGARTLAGNDNEWRYISVRRTMTMIEQTAKDMLKSYAFSPNDSSTWTNVKSMLEIFLDSLWKQGALAGSTSNQAFNVKIGLGETMTQQDILDGFLKVSLMLAVVRPAEFIVVNIEQELAAS